MPNWCMNSATITGSKEKLEAIVEAIKEEKLFEYLAPIGEWDYGTAVETWGTKWEAQDVDWDLDYDSNTLTLNFSTAWGPGINAYILGMENHDLEIEAYYYEPGMMFCGYFDNGDDTCWEIDFVDEEYKDDIDQHVIDHWDLDYEYESWKEWQEEENEDED